MKKLITIATTLLIIIQLSCTKETTETCKYKNKEYTDTSLFISFTLDGINRKFYQMMPTVEYGYTHSIMIYK